jgi:hypothetical protein
MREPKLHAPREESRNGLPRRDPSESKQKQGPSIRAKSDKSEI